MMIGTAGLELILVVDVKICQDRTKTCPCPRSRHRSSSWPRASPPPPCRTPHGYRPGNPCHVLRHFNGFVWRHCLSHVSFTSLTGCSTWEWRREICLCSLQSWPWTRAPHRSAPADTSDPSCWKFLWWNIFHLKILVRECWAVDGEASRAVPLGEVAPLHHEVLHHAVEGALLVALSWLSWKKYFLFSTRSINPRTSCLAASCAMFSQVLGTTLPNSPMRTRPALSPSMLMSKKTSWGHSVRW